MVDEKKLERLAEYYGNQDISGEIETAALEQHPPMDQVMIISEISLPKELMDRLRNAAAEDGVEPAVLMRRWIEAGLR
jgi:hypothetical protein